MRCFSVFLCTCKGPLPCRMPSHADTVYMQRLMRDVVPDAFEKFFNENSIKTWSPLVQDDILHAAFVLMDLITAQLKVYSHHHLCSQESANCCACHNSFHASLPLLSTSQDTDGIMTEAVSLGRPTSAELAEPMLWSLHQLHQSEGFMTSCCFGS